VTRTIRAAFVAAAVVALFAVAVPVRAGGGVTRGTADIQSTEGFEADGLGTYFNGKGDEVSFGERGVFGSNYFFFQVGSSRSPRFTRIDHPVTDLKCLKTIFTVSSPDGDVDWFTNNNPLPSYGQARLICDAEDRHRYEFRWGYGAAADCVEISGVAATGFTFQTLPGCTATYEAQFKSRVVATAPAVALPFVVKAAPNP
jgi:hypothetical protein